MDTIPHSLGVIGWREWLALPALGIAAIKTKVDTGARSSALHVSELEDFHRDGKVWVRFRIATHRKARGAAMQCEAAVVDKRAVTDSSGAIAERWFIRTEVVLAGQSWATEINLTDRRTMLFPMLLGRTALNARFLVDPSRSYLCGKPRRTSSSTNLQP